MSRFDISFFVIFPVNVKLFKVTKTPYVVFLHNYTYLTEEYCVYRLCLSNTAGLLWCSNKSGCLFRLIQRTDDASFYDRCYSTSFSMINAFCLNSVWIIFVASRASVSHWLNDDGPGSRHVIPDSQSDIFWTSSFYIFNRGCFTATVQNVSLQQLVPFHVLSCFPCPV